MQIKCKGCLASTQLNWDQQILPICLNNTKYKNQQILGNVEGHYVAYFEQEVESSTTELTISAVENFDLKELEHT